MSEITLTEADKGESVEVRPGDVVIVRLREIPTSGYRWAIDAPAGDVVALDRSEFSAASGTGVGGGGSRVLRFRAQRAGTAHLRLKNWREWEGDTSVRDRFDVTIHVRD